MKHSDSIAKLAFDLVAAQDDIRAVEKSAVNPHFKSKYMPLDSIIAMARPVLAKHHLAVVQAGEASEDGKSLAVETRLIHASGEWLSSVVSIPVAKLDPQGAGAALTYGRRFGLSAMLAISSEDDDDGNTASRPAPQAARSPVRPNPPADAKKDEDKLAGGKRLGEYTSDDLRKILSEKTGNEFVTLRKSITAVLANRQLA